MATPPKTTYEPEAQFDTDKQLKLDNVHDVIQHPDKFAQVFVSAANTQVKIKQLIRKEIKESLTLDPDLIKHVKGLIKDQFKEDWRAFLKSTGGKIAFGIWTIGLLILGAWLGHVWK